MPANQVIASKRFVWEAAEQNAEEEVDSRTSEGSSSSSSNGSNQPHQNENSVVSSSSCPASISLPPRSNGIAKDSKHHRHQQSAISLLSSPSPGTPVAAPATTEALQPFQHGQEIDQFLLSQHMSTVNPGTLKVLVNHAGPCGMRNPLKAEVNSYYYPTSKMTADYRLDSTPRPQMGIGASPPFIESQQIMSQRQHNFEQTANNPGSHPVRPQHGYLQASIVTQAKGYTCGGPDHQMLLNMAIPPYPISPVTYWYMQGQCRLGLMGDLKYKQEMQGSNGQALMKSEAVGSSARGWKRKMAFQDESPSPSHTEQLLNWFPKGLDNPQRLELSSPTTTTTTTPRYNISLYDPAFKTMGLPVDPHLRMFLAMNGKNVGPK